MILNIYLPETSSRSARKIQLLEKGFASSCTASVSCDDVFDSRTFDIDNLHFHRMSQRPSSQNGTDRSKRRSLLSEFIVPSLGRSRTTLYDHPHRRARTESLSLDRSIPVQSRTEVDQADEGLLILSRSQLREQRQSIERNDQAQFQTSPHRVSRYISRFTEALGHAGDEEIVAPNQDTDSPNMLRRIVTRDNHSRTHPSTSRAVTQPSSPAQQTTPISIPRSSTFPGSGSARGDVAFSNASDIQLFAEAMSGLSPEPSFGSSPPMRPSARRRDEDRASFRRSVPSDLTFSSGNASTILSASHRMDQLPGDLHLPYAAPINHFPIQPSNTTNIPPPTIRPMSSYSPVSHSSPWAAIPHENIISPRPVIPENFYPDEDRLAYDDELPDYATSQAQAQAHLRVEAARRAQELQQRWHLSGSQYGHR